MKKILLVFCLALPLLLSCSDDNDKFDIVGTWVADGVEIIEIETDSPESEILVRQYILDEEEKDKEKSIIFMNDRTGNLVYKDGSKLRLAYALYYDILSIGKLENGQSFLQESELRNKTKNSFVSYGNILRQSSANIFEEYPELKDIDIKKLHIEYKYKRVVDK